MKVASKLDSVYFMVYFHGFLSVLNLKRTCTRTCTPPPASYRQIKFRAGEALPGNRLEVDSLLAAVASRMIPRTHPLTGFLSQRGFVVACRKAVFYSSAPSTTGSVAGAASCNTSATALIAFSTLPSSTSVMERKRFFVMDLAFQIEAFDSSR